MYVWPVTTDESVISCIQFSLVWVFLFAHAYSKAIMPTDHAKIG